MKICLPVGVKYRRSASIQAGLLLGVEVDVDMGLECSLALPLLLVGVWFARTEAGLGVGGRYGSGNSSSLGA